MYNRVLPINNNTMDLNNKFIKMSVQASIVVFGLLAVFLLSKTITEVVSWGKNTETYPARTITVMAEGEAIATSDIASFSFSVNENADTSEAAQTKAEDKIKKAMEYFKSNGVDEKDIKTEYYNVYPKYEPYAPCYAFDCPAPVEKIVGYEVSQGIRVKVRDTDNAGKFLSELTKFEINNVSGLTFTIDDEEVLYDEARKNAIEKAEEKAKVLADGLDVRLGKVISFNEDNAGAYGDYGYAAEPMMKSASNVSLPKGENTFTTKVYVTYELK
jgi:hypothetical protein